MSSIVNGEWTLRKGESNKLYFRGAQIAEFDDNDLKDFKKLMMKKSTVCVVEAQYVTDEGIITSDRMIYGIFDTFRLAIKHRDELNKISKKMKAKYYSTTINVKPVAVPDYVLKVKELSK